MNRIRRTAPSLLCTMLVTIVTTEARVSDCTNISVDLVPLTGLSTGTYKGMTGGLYGAGENESPPEHANRGLVAGARIVPRAGDGTPDSAGRVVLISIGMSNTSLEFSTFRDLARRDARLSPALVIVNGAQGGVTASEWADPFGSSWTELDRRLSAAGVARPQVQVAWVKLANRAGGASADAYRLQLERDSLNTLRNLRDRFPNLQIIYSSSRIYAGYASSSLNPEPYAYESGFVVKRIIQRQIAGQLSGRPWLSWGPYLWADGLTPRSDGLTWNCSDFASDGTHPSAAGRLKVADLLLRFFEADASAHPWFFGGAAESTPESSGSDLLIGTDAVGDARRLVIGVGVSSKLQVCAELQEGTPCITLEELRERLRARWP